LFPAVFSVVTSLKIVELKNLPIFLENLPIFLGKIFKIFLVNASLFSLFFKKWSSNLRKAILQTL